MKPWSVIYEENKIYYDPLAEFISGFKPRTGLEIGFGDYGISARAFLENCDGELISIDKRDWLGYAAQWVELFHPRFAFVLSDSKLVNTSRFPEFDYIYIDGDHTYAGCLADLVKFVPLLRPQGVVIVDDYGVDYGMVDYNSKHEIINASFGVKEACDEYFIDWWELDLPLANGGKAYVNSTGDSNATPLT